ncbi:MAG: gliding motility-associated C-terminal domain-containing protein [Bacteroidales bacterium]|nr:gliding motility-associated C-terminal domain-containing protein [Bacteroidales bacterium]MCF8328546.1 gliding motility-associated C-terminal domain-containing protein [Bacteroidales bacterium]
MNGKRFVLLFVYLLLVLLLHAAFRNNATALAPAELKSQKLIGDTLPSPEMKCLSMQDTGHVDAYWATVPDPTASFHCYILYRNQNASGVFNLVDTIWNRSINTSQDISAQAIPGSYYYISTVSEVQPATYFEVPGDTFQTIDLDVTNPGTSSGLAQLSWNAPGFQNSSGLPYFHIYKKQNNSAWKLEDSVQSLNYTDTITVCQGEVSYQIRLPESSFCISQSDIDGGTFEDKTSPNTPEIDSVSVLADGINVSWNKNSIEDTWGYIIYKKINNLWTPLDTLYGVTNNHFIDTSSDGCTDQELYNVLAFDSCWNTSSSGKNHQNIVLDLDYSVCDLKAELSWNEYINMKDSLKEYRVYRSTNGGNYQVLDVLPSGQTQLVDSNLTDSTKYCYYVRAYNYQGNRTSSTCEQCFYYTMPPGPEFIYLSSASVSHSNGAIKLRGIVDSNNVVKGITIYRSQQIASNYTAIDTIPWNGTGEFDYQDKTALSDSVVYYYQAFATDSCGQETTKSNVVNNILLEKANIEFMKNRLLWNEFDGWEGLPSKYDVYRREKEEADFQSVATDLFYNGGSYDDDVSALYPTTGDFYYYIKARESNVNSFGNQDSSLSNRILIRQESKIYIPNAFTPGGRNPIFKPFNVYVDVSDYHFRIYNRYGKEIFHSKEPSEGWDGRVDGEKAPVGTYVYILEFTSKNGNSRQLKGSVILLR